MGRKTKTELANGSYTEREYNEVNKLVKISNKKSDGTVISSFEYTFDNAGNILTKTNHNNEVEIYNMMNCIS